jgi:hypothetical protein
MLEYFAIVLVFAPACGAVLVFMIEWAAAVTAVSHFAPTGNFESEQRCSEQEMGGAFLGRGNSDFRFRGMRHDLRESFPLARRGSVPEMNEGRALEGRCRRRR